MDVDDPSFKFQSDSINTIWLQQQVITYRALNSNLILLIRSRASKKSKTTALL